MNGYVRNLIYNYNYKDMEIILCASIHYNKGKMSHPPKNMKEGITFSGYRHSNCFGLFACFYNIEEVDHSLMEQGFLTSENRFVDRMEGFQIAIKAGQIIPINEKDKGPLFSEDLY